MIKIKSIESVDLRKYRLRENIDRESAKIERVQIREGIYPRHTVCIQRVADI